MLEIEKTEIVIDGQAFHVRPLSRKEYRELMEFEAGLDSETPGRNVWLVSDKALDFVLSPEETELTENLGVSVTLKLAEKIFELTGGESEESKNLSTSGPG